MTMQIDGEIVGYCTPGNSNIDPELWFSDLKHEYDYAKSLCRTRCPVRITCFEGAIERREQYGVWGGIKFGRDATRRLEKAGLVP